MSAHHRPGLPGRGGIAVPAAAGLAGAALCVAVLWTTAAPAMAHGVPLVVVGQVEGEAAISFSDFSFSIDGEEYSGRVPELFADAPRLVPGENLEKRLWVRNNNEVKVTVSVSPQTTAKTVGAALAEVSPSPAVALAPGEAAPLLVRLELADSAGNASQGNSWPVKLQFNFSEAAPGEEDPLAHTGAGTGIWPLAGGALMAGAGAYLVSRKRTVQR